MCPANGRFSGFLAEEEVNVEALERGQLESLWDEVLPVGVRELPEDLAALDVLLRDRGLLAPLVAY
jgi:hypothetical protein